MKPKPLSSIFTSLLAYAIMSAPNLKAQEVTIGGFTGADLGEGLDLSTADGGEFIYAINVGGLEPIEVGELTFTVEDEAPGVTWDAVNHISAWGGINEFGPDDADQALAEVMHSIRWSPAPQSVTVTLNDVVPGTNHRLQLLFAEKCCQRGWDITVNGELIADEFNVRELSNDADLTMGAYLSYEFVPTGTTIEIDLNGADADFTDQNPILSAVTLERTGNAADDPNFVTSSKLAFGQVASTPASTQSLTLRSLGASQAAVISEVRLIGPNAANFSVSAAPDSLAPGETATVNVTFDALSASGLFQGVLEFVSNDPSDPVQSVELSASVINRNGPAVNLTMDDAAASDEVRDVSGNDRHARVVVGAGTLDLGQAALASGTAARFADGGHVSVAGTSLDEALDSFAISMWINVEATPAGLQTLIGKGDLETPTFAVLMFGDALAWFTGGEAPEFTSESVITAGQTHHVAAIYDNTLGARRASLYVDGEVAATVEDPIEILDSTSFDVFVGAYNGALPFAGVIDNVQLYDRLITAEDVVFLKNNPAETLGGDGAVDSDGDGLTDTEEVAAMTDPLLTDTDGDGLEDGAEVKTHLTNPLVMDTDGDGFGDEVELRKGSDPLLAASVPESGLEVSTFTGGDPGEGLDLEGSFVYAINMFGPGGSQVGDALFTDDAVDGFTIEATNNILNWHAPNYGDSANDDGLELVLQSIRWDTAPVVMTLERLTVGQRYVLQLLFAENCCERGFDIVINGETEADEFSPDAVHERSPTMGAVAKYTFTAKQETLNITLANEDAAFPDVNPIINGLTLKQVGVDGDSDGDGLLDVWELAQFGDLTQGPNDDFDNDGLSNSRELELQTNATLADTDGDGLSDGVEVTDTMTDPRLLDSDSDGLSDGFELNDSKTDPLLADSDSDGQQDAFELLYSGDPNDGDSQGTLNVSSDAFTGGDEGEGLDLDGAFVYAINLLGDGDLQVRDALFTTDEIDGFTFDQPNEILDWHAPDYGDSSHDDNLEIIMQSIRWNGGPVNMSLGKLETGTRYKLQMLFAENCCDRGWDIALQGGKILDDFNVQLLQGGIANPEMGVVVTTVFTAPKASVDIQFINDAPAFADNNPILNGMTLERLTGGDPVVGEGDTDRDGVGDADEAIAGTDPNNAADYFRIAGTTRTTTGVSMTWQAVAGKLYDIEYSETLEAGQWVTIATGLDAGSFEDTDAMRTGRSNGYYRAVVK